MELNELIDALAKQAADEELGVFVTDMQRAQCVETVHEAMKYAVGGTDVKTTCEMNEPYISMGVVSVVGKEIVITDTKMFALAAKLADNIEVYPKVDGTVQINFTFHRLARKVGN